MRRGSVVGLGRVLVLDFFRVVPCLGLCDGCVCSLM